MKLRIVVADDNPAFLGAVVSMLEAEFEVVATAADGNAAVERIRQHQPDVAVLDLAMPGLSGIDVTKAVTNHHPGSAVVICSVETDPEILRAARQAGALGYVFKVRVGEDLRSAIKSAARGQSFVSPG
jgi:DNA-binding NarL/FixJ family response regulator